MERKDAFAGIDWMPVKSDYKDIDDIIRSLKIGKVDGDQLSRMQQALLVLVRLEVDAGGLRRRACPTHEVDALGGRVFGQAE